MSLLGWLAPLLDADQQRALDEWAIREQGVAGLELMERAGEGLADLVCELAPTGSVAVVCGKGNNGGDGFVAARHLRARGRRVEVLALVDPEELRGDARESARRLEGEAPARFSAATLRDADAIVDAILGTGFSGEPRGVAAQAIEAINAVRADVPVIACDVPSGVDASTGEVAAVAVRAAATATFHAAKPGLYIDPGKSHAGRVRVLDIGIPVGGAADVRLGLIADEVLTRIPRRGAASTKFAAGSVLVCGGSTGLTGAPCMVSQAAMRAGAGYVTACVPESLHLVFESHLLEVMTVPLPDTGGSLTRAALQEVLDRSRRVRSMVLGPGLGREEEALALAREAAGAIEVPLVLDADGLNAHAGRLESLRGRPAATVLTPHAGELGRLLSLESTEVQARRLHWARRAASQAQAIVVLKGDDTLVASPDGLVAISPGGAPALATAGTGDVLAGVIGALLAKQMDPFEAACAGVLLHVRAGQAAARRIGPEGVIARDVIESLPAALGGR